MRRWGVRLREPRTCYHVETHRAGCQLRLQNKEELVRLVMDLVTEARAIDAEIKIWLLYRFALGGIRIGLAEIDVLDVERELTREENKLRESEGRRHSAPLGSECEIVLRGSRHPLDVVGGRVVSSVWLEHRVSDRTLTTKIRLAD